MKANVTRIQIGNVEFDGLMDQNGKFYVAIPQMVDLGLVPPNRSQKQLESLLGMVFSSHVKLKTERNSKPLNSVSLLEFETIVAKLDRSGNKAAQDFRDLMVGLSLHQLFSDAFNIKFEKAERQEFIEKRLAGKVSRRTFTDAIRDYLARHPETPGQMARFMYSNASDLVNYRVLDRRAKQIKDDWNLTESQLIRDKMNSVELSRVQMIEDEATILVDEFDTEPCEAVRQVSAKFLFAPSRR